MAALGLGIAAVAAAATYLAMTRPAAPADADRNFTLTRVTANRGVTSFPTLARDGTLLAYASDSAGEGNLDIWIQRSDANEPRQLTTNPANDYEPVFSPDGARLVFRSDRDGGGLYTVSSLGGSERLLVAGGRGAQFSPDGKWIAYWTGEPGASFQPGSAKVFVISSLGGVPGAIPARISGCRFPHLVPRGRPDSVLRASFRTSRNQGGLVDRSLSNRFRHGCHRADELLDKVPPQSAFV